VMCCTCRDVHKEFKKRGYSLDQQCSSIHQTVL
jgi:hypothetical protein